MTKQDRKPTAVDTWIPALGVSTAAVDMDTALSCSLIAWLLTQLAFPRKRVAPSCGTPNQRSLIPDPQSLIPYF